MSTPQSIYQMQWRKEKMKDPEFAARYKAKHKEWIARNKERLHEQAAVRWRKLKANPVKHEPHKKRMRELARNAVGPSKLRRIIQWYRDGAAKRGYKFKLTDEEIEWFVKQPCHYCGISPAKGMDRIDNEPVYDLDTVVPCCKTDNFGKHTSTHDEYMSHLRRVTDYMNKKDKEATDL